MSERERQPERKKETPYLEFRWEDIPPGTCRIMRFGDKRIAVCKDEDDRRIRLYEVIGEE